MDYIHKVYPGGIEGFTRGGGDLTYLPESIILSIPEENDKLKENIKQMFHDTTIYFLSDPFEMDPNIFSDIRNELIKLLMADEVGIYAQGVSITLRSCYVLIQSMANLPQSLVKVIRNMIEEFGVPRAIFVQPNRLPEFWESIELEDKPVLMDKPSHKGETVISSEQIINLKIDLNKEQDVMDFLKSLEG